MSRVAISISLALLWIEKYFQSFSLHVAPTSLPLISFKPEITLEASEPFLAGFQS